MRRQTDFNLNSIYQHLPGSWCISSHRNVAPEFYLNTTGVDLLMKRDWINGLRRFSQRTSNELQDLTLEKVQYVRTNPMLLWFSDLCGLDSEPNHSLGQWFCTIRIKNIIFESFLQHAVDDRVCDVKQISILIQYLSICQSPGTFPRTET